MAGRGNRSWLYICHFILWQRRGNFNFMKCYANMSPDVICVPYMQSHKSPSFSTLRVSCLYKKHEIFGVKRACWDLLFLYLDLRCHNVSIFDERWKDVFVCQVYKIWIYWDFSIFFLSKKKSEINIGAIQ